MDAQKIITRFELYVDDGTELSTSEELDLLNKIYREVWTDRPWEFSKKPFSGTINGTTITLPTDFAYICENARYTDMAQNNYVRNSVPKIVWVGDKYYRLINWSDRKQYENQDGVCWIDLVNNKLTFPISVSGTVEYDYVFFPDDLAIDDEPLFPAMFHDVIYHGMASDDYMIQQFDKAKSYAAENRNKYNEWLDKMAMWNMNLICN